MVVIAGPKSNTLVKLIIGESESVTKYTTFQRRYFSKWVLLKAVPEHDRGHGEREVILRSDSNSASRGLSIQIKWTYLCQNELETGGKDVVRSFEVHKKQCKSGCA